MTGVCADPEELQDGQLPSSENEQGEGKPCVVHSDCPDDLLCIENKCLYECQTHYDCPSGECKDHHCIPLAPPTAPCAPGQQVSCRCSPGVPGVHGLPLGDFEKENDVHLDGVLGASLVAEFRWTLVDGGRTLWLEEMPMALPSAPPQPDGQAPPASPESPAPADEPVSSSAAPARPAE